MQNDSWFKLAVLAFVGIIISSLMLSLIKPDNSQSANNHTAHTQSMPGMTMPGMTDQQSGGMNGTSDMYQSQINELQNRLLEMQNRLNYMSGYGMPYGAANGVMPVNPGVQYRTWPFGYPGYTGGNMYSPNTYMNPGNMNPGMNNQGGMNNNSNSNSGMSGGSGGGMSMM